MLSRISLLKLPIISFGTSLGPTSALWKSLDFSRCLFEWLGYLSPASSLHPVASFSLYWTAHHFWTHGHLCLQAFACALPSARMSPFLPSSWKTLHILQGPSSDAPSLERFLSFSPRIEQSCFFLMRCLILWANCIRVSAGTTMACVDKPVSSPPDPGSS